MRKKFLAKLLVLCMVLSMLPIVALAASTSTRASDTCSISLDVTGNGTVSVTYAISSDTTVSQAGPGTATYTINGDVKFKTVTVTPNPGQTLSSATLTYTIGSDTTGNMALSSGANSLTNLPAGVNAISVSAVFTTASSGGAAGGGSSSGTTNQTQTVTNPSVSAGNTVVAVEVKPTVSGTTASAAVTSANMTKAVESVLEEAAKSGTNPVVEVRVDTPANATGLRLTLPTTSLTALGEHNNATLTLTSDVADITLDSAAITSLASAAGQSVVVSVTPVPASTLSTAQREAVGDAPVIDFSITGNNGASITSFGGGVLSIAVPYQLPAGQSASDVVVWHLSDAGVLTECDTSYSAGTVRFTTTHLSKYVIATAALGATDTPPASITFTDVSANEFYYDAVIWAVEQGITTGIGNNQFGPNGVCTRAQMVTFLWRAAGSPAVSGTTQFTDVDSTAFYYQAVLWAVQQGITTGTGNNQFSPDAAVTRGQTVTFLYRFAGSPAVSGGNSFTDVPAGQYYTDAVNWAVAQGITTGVGNNQFAPNSDCTRGQIVTFLYRQLAG